MTKSAGIGGLAVADWDELKRLIEAGGYQVQPWQAQALIAENEELRQAAKLDAADLAWSESDSREQSAEIGQLKAELERLQAQQKPAGDAGGAGGAENCRCNEKVQVVQELQAELERVRAKAARASYWKQRAKSAEGHLLAGDLDVAAKALHKRTAMASTPWEELADDKRLQIQQAAFEVIHAVNSQRDERMPANAALGKGGGQNGSKTAETRVSAGLEGGGQGGNSGGAENGIKTGETREIDGAEGGAEKGGKADG
ncbi:hypothetical protein [Azotobacter vinelandii]|uniref:hypothetical protein n=1 Tax=Azotobacter vinelandii TaxID=354 RepID=UPI002664FBA7|nr:hypothetical protein [Azotobacter vinelandii]WKN20838.1 hypothetical protein AVAEIV_003864 [Azotobacter vinelandii]